MRSTASRSPGALRKGAEHDVAGVPGEAHGFPKWLDPDFGEEASGQSCRFREVLNATFRCGSLFMEFSDASMGQLKSPFLQGP